MGLLSPDQRNLLYLQAAARSGIHKSILAALYQVQKKPSLTDGETGLGISPANRITLAQVDTFAAQVHYAANTIRSLTNSLTVEGWKGTELWSSEQGRYTDKFVQAIAAGHTAPSSDPTAALLESSNYQSLLQAYISDLSTDVQALKQPHADIDQTFIALIGQLPSQYLSLPHQREALLELVRLWRKLDTQAAAIASLNLSSTPDERALDAALLQFLPLIGPNYSGYPHQREALLRLVQLWQQLDSREAAIAALPTFMAPDQSLLDPALIALVQHIPASYAGKGEQRNAIVEGFRLWQQVDTRSEALMVLGVNPDIFTRTPPDQAEITNAAIQIDRALLDFIRDVPVLYQGTAPQRDALLHLTQLWRSLDTPEQAIQSLLNDLKRMQTARRDTPESPPRPVAQTLPFPPDRWTPDNLQIYAPIIPHGSFTWAEATRGGMHLPTNQATVDAIVQIAQRAQSVRDRLGRPPSIVRWYTPSSPEADPLSSHRYSLGDAIVIYCEGLTGNQLYWFLDPWWTGGLGCYTDFPYLCYLDARRDRVRWRQPSGIRTL